jgi:hypothetical protein
MSRTQTAQKIEEHQTSKAQKHNGDWILNDPEPVSAHKRSALRNRNLEAGAKEKCNDEDDDGKPVTGHDIPKRCEYQHNHNAE